MNLEIIIDNRETSLYNNMMERDLDKFEKKITITKKQLEIGDIHLVFNDNIYVYERKTMNDLISSIKDGRYKEQKLRLLSDKSFNNINYIIEGSDIISSNNNHNQELLTSIYYNSIYRDNINIIFSKNVNDTTTFILLLATKIIKKPDNFIKEKQQLSTDYIDNCKIKTKKCDNIDKETCYLLQLSQIPGISKQIAKNIKDVYPTMILLLKALQTSSDEPSKLLMKIDNIGQQKANKIIEYLL
jgi:crossover junction endonuclease MUS81